MFIVNPYVFATTPADPLDPYNFATARYWRLGWQESMTGANPSCSRMWFIDDTGGLITPSGGTAISSGDLGGFPASNAFDGTDTTHWVSSSTTSNNDTINAYVGYDFGASVTKSISGVRYRNRADTFGVNEGPRFAQLDYSSDGSTWTTLFKIINVTAYSSGGTIRNWIDQNRFSGGHRYWRMVTTATQSAGRFSLQQIKWHVGSDTGTDIITDTTNYNTINTYSNDGQFSQTFRTEKVMDSVQTTRFAADATDQQGTLTFDFGPVNRPNMTNVTLISTNDSFGSDEAPTSFTFEYSDNGSSWTTAYTGSESSWGDNETRTFSF